MMSPSRWLLRQADAFEIEGRNRILPMEGLRGIAVALVFLQHYCAQFQIDGRVTGAAAMMAGAFRNYGNRGVELFFVLSGFLIYGILLRKNPGFLDFMARRAQRLYPAFLAALVIAFALDHFRPVPLMPAGAVPAAIYLGENLAFLPGLFPITPISAVNWSLSYEWWFYASCTALFVLFGLRGFSAKWRVALILAAAGLLMLLSALGFAQVPIRGLSLLAGMLLAEAARAKFRAANPAVATALVAIVFAASLLPLPAWAGSLLLAGSFGLVCSAAFFRAGWLSAALSWAPLRWLGNISYSFYLVHGFVVVTVLHFLNHVPARAIDLAFWLGLGPLFAAAFLVSACLFLMVEKPFSLDVRAPRHGPAPTEDAGALDLTVATKLCEAPVMVAPANVANGGPLSLS